MSFSNKHKGGSFKSKKKEMNFGSDTKSKLKEKDVGITEYIGKHEGFSGIIKQRFSDFHVNEIDIDGKIISLTDTTPPAVEAPGSKADHEKSLKDVVSEDVFDRIKNLADHNESSEFVEIEVTEKTKDERKILHNAIKSVGAGKLVSNTKEKDGKKFIVINNHKSNQSGIRERRSGWPSIGDYVHFVLYKENIDTMDCVNLIASKLRIKPNMLSYAGTKDRRGKTSQMMSVWRIEPKKLAEVSSQLRCVTLGNYTFKPKGLQLGDLQGNRFRIVLRNVIGNDEQIEQVMRSLSEKGFLNYYGLQRFGCCSSVPTYEIGKALLQGNWKLAIELILKPREGEPNKDLVEARKIWWKTRNASRAFQVLKNREKLIEGKLLLGLSLCKPNDYVNALEKIPRNMRLLYLHSYQSLIWNKVVSRRVKEFGLQPLPGDLIFLSKSQNTIFDGPEEANIENEVGDDVNGEELDKEVAKDVNSASDQKKLCCTVISEKDLSSINIHDVVMPLPGHDVMYPDNLMKDWYEDLLKEDGLSSATLKQNVRKYSVSGTYRKMIVRPSKMSWRMVHYSNPEETLELSDTEIMKNSSLPKDDADGVYKALVLDFCLPSSTYATMALREILKADTSSDHQASLNTYHDAHTSKVDTKINESTPSEEVLGHMPKENENQETNTPTNVNDPPKLPDMKTQDVEMNIAVPDDKLTVKLEQEEAQNCLKRKEDNVDDNDTSSKKIKFAPSSDVT